MYDPDMHGFCHEFYTVEKTIEIVLMIGGEDRELRIQAMKNEIASSYTTSAYIKEIISENPRITVWASYVQLPWTKADSADAALQQALGYLRG